MLVPLTDYHAGSSAAAFVGHAHAYDWALAQYFGGGLINTQVGGDTLFSDNATHAVIRKWTTFVRDHRETLIQPIIHLRRASILHLYSYLYINAAQAAGTSSRRGLVGVFRRHRRHRRRHHHRHRRHMSGREGCDLPSSDPSNGGQCATFILYADNQCGMTHRFTLTGQWTNLGWIHAPASESTWQWGGAGRIGCRRWICNHLQSRRALCCCRR